MTLPEISSISVGWGDTSQWEINYTSVGWGDTSQIEKRIQELEEKLRKEEPKMRSLFKVYVVDPKGDGKVVIEDTQIAETQEKALLKSIAASGKQVDVDKVDTLVVTLGTFIRPRKETQKVEMVKPEE